MRRSRLSSLPSAGTPSATFASDSATCGWPGVPGCRAGLARHPAAPPRCPGLVPGRSHSQPAARHLVVTDVAAEGLDLQRARRVVHYDLPWTPMRLEQREGRAVRLGSRHSEVEVVRFAPVPILERSLHLEATLARKAKLPAAAGLGAGGRHIWRWRTELAERFGECEATAGLAQVLSPHRGLLAGFAFHSASDPRERLSSTIGWLEIEGGWTETPEVIGDRLNGRQHKCRAGAWTPICVAQYLALLAPLIRSATFAHGRSPLALSRTRRRQRGGWPPAEAAHRTGGQAAPPRFSAGARASVGICSRWTYGGGGNATRAVGSRFPLSELTSRLSGVRAAQTGWQGIDVRLTGLIVFSPDSVG